MTVPVNFLLINEGHFHGVSNLHLHGRGADLLCSTEHACEVLEEACCDKIGLLPRFEAGQLGKLLLSGHSSRINPK